MAPHGAAYRPARGGRGADMAEEGSTGVIDDGGKLNDATDWKAEARKWEARAKANSEKAKAYDEAP